MVSAVLLAAGESKRMGEFKQLLPIAGKTFVARSVDNLLASRASEVVVVTGYREEDVRRALGHRPVRFAHNPYYRLGMSESIKRGVEAVAETARAVLIALVDQPLVEPEIIDRLIEAYETHEALIVVPTSEGRNGHPVILDLSLKREILEIAPDRGLRQVVQAHKSETLHVEVASRAILLDFDYPEDYERLKEL
ncbi:MAG TPA: nucleotidyltransferase family protein [Blastocatellia bacterium]|nr:nucleotidyltransferase family protein [Blastocatellia bacterium]